MMGLPISAVQGWLALVVPLFIGFQLVERLYFFNQIVSPVFLAVVPVLFLLLWLSGFVRERGAERPSALVVLFLCLCGLVIGCLVAQKIWIFDRYDLSSRSALGFATLTGTYAVTWGLIGLSVSRVILKKSDLAAVVFMAGVGVLVIPNMTYGYVNLIALREETGIESLSHLWISENIVFLFCLSYGFARSYLVKMVLLVLVAIFLVAMLGRSSLFFTLASISVFELLFGGFKGLARKLAIGGGLALLGLGVVLGIQWFYSEPILDKLLFKGGLGEDASFEARSQLFSEGLFYLKEQLWIGDPTILATEMGSVGAYIHNLLSVWQVFGFFVFLALVVAIFIALFRMFKILRSVSNNPLFDSAALLLIYSVLSVLTTKNGGFWCLWFAVGLWFGAKGGQVAGFPAVGEDGGVRGFLRRQ